MRSHFYAYLNRMKYIRHWGLMHSTSPENDMEHAAQTALLAHGIALIARERYHRDIDPEHVLALALYHDAQEVVTGDLPTPVKYHSPELQSAYHRMEKEAAERIVALAPEELREAYRPYFTPSQNAAHQLVKAADRIAAYIKCVEERQAGNREFLSAEASILKSIQAIDLPEVQDFFRECVPSFGMNLDEISGGDEA